MTTRSLAIAVMFVPALARGDSEELTFRVEALAVGALSEDYGEHGSRTFAPTPGGAVHVGYGVSDTLELGLGFAASYTSREEFDDVALPGSHTNRGSLEQTELVWRTTADAELHLGRRALPVIRLLAGYQHRSLTNADYFEPGSGKLLQIVPDRSDDDLLVGIGLAYAVRLTPHFGFSIGVHFVHAFSLDHRGYDAVEIPISLSYSFYPRWFSGSHFETGGQPLVEE